jgi:hypothetical protein
MPETIVNSWSTPPMTVARPYLAVFRAGRGTVHRRMMAEDPARNWDCALNAWEAPATIPGPATEEIQFLDGNHKYEGMASFLERERERVLRYRYVLLADDDIYFRPGDLSRLFQVCDAHRIHLGQPALRWGTNVNHFVTLWNPASRVRRVSFVEVMTPVFSAAALLELAPTFSLTRSTYGIDWAWAALLRDRAAIHIIDAVQVEHVRKVDWEGGAFYRKLQGLGVNPATEMRAVRARFGEFGGIRTLRRGHRARLPLGATLGDASVVLFDRLILGLRVLLDRAWRLSRRLRGRPIPHLPEDNGDPASK